MPVLAIVLHSNILAQPGTLDSSFANDGVFTFHPDFTGDNVLGMALTNDGKILVLTKVDYSSYLSRFLADGTVDTSFGEAGTLGVLLSEASNASITVDASDRIIIMALSLYFYDQGFDLFRYLPDGTPDSSFNGVGVVQTNIEQFSNALITQPDGKIIVGGKISSNNSLQRFNEDGTEDANFSNNFNNALDAFATGNIFGINLQQDGKIVVTGTTEGDLLIGRINADGSADSGFGNDGFYIVDSPNGEEGGLSIAIMPDQSLIVSGESESLVSSMLMCWKFQSSGLPDLSFGINGNVILHTSTKNDFGWFAIPQNDTTAIIGATVYNGINHDPVLYHVLKDGTVDSAFGINGAAGNTFSTVKFIKLYGAKTSEGNIIYCGTMFDNGSYLTAISQININGNVDSSFAINGTMTHVVGADAYTYDRVVNQTQLPDGKILVVGTSFLDLYGAFLTLFRLNADGSLDITYGKDGYFVPPVERSTEWVTVAGDSSAEYIAESYSSPIYGVEDLVQETYPYQFLVHKLDSEGNHNIYYGDSGIAKIDLSGYQLYFFLNAAIQTDGKLLLAGRSYTDNSDSIFVIRLNEDGSTDITFGNSGIQTFNWGDGDDEPRVAVRSDGKIILQSKYYVYDTTYINLSRLLSDGTLDSTFGTNGSTEFAIAYILDMKLQEDNKIVLLSDSLVNYKLIRFNEDGMLDLGFGNTGTFSFDLGNFYHPDFTIQPDGKIIMAGNTDNGLAVVRFLNNGFFDETFGDGGISVFDTSYTGDATSMHPISLQNDGKILVGTADEVSFYVARVLNDVATDIENSFVINQALRVFPNPVSDRLILQTLFSEKEKATIIISNSMGQVVKQQPLNDNEDKVILDVEHLTAGVYCITYISSNHVTTGKFVKQ